jgi:putative sigma-54 modulation protein
MDIHLTARHMELTDGLRTHVEERLGRLTRIYGRLTDLHVILTAEKHGQIAEISTSVNGRTLVSREESQDMYASVDRAVDKMERQLKTVREKITNRKGRLPARGGGIEEPREREVTSRIASAPSNGEITFVHEETIPVYSRSMEDALSELNRGTTDFVVFENQDTAQVSVIYKRRDGNLGLIEPLG